MGLIDNLKIAGEQATASARVSLHEAQLRRELDLAYAELGRITYGLLEQGVVANEPLTPVADRIQGLEHERASLMVPTLTPPTP